jgi:hypothetical protein
VHSVSWRFVVVLGAYAVLSGAVQRTPQGGEGTAFEALGAGVLPPLEDQSKLLAPEASPQTTGPVIPVPGQPASIRGRIRLNHIPSRSYWVD